MYRRYLSLGRLHEIRAGLCETLIIARTYVKPCPKMSRCRILSSFASLFRATFFHLQSSRSVLAPCAIPRCSHSPFLTSRATPHRIYSTYGGRYVLWLIVLLSLTYFQFTAAARRFASWLSIVRDERRFMCHPEYSDLRSARSVLSARYSYRTR
jgi:hypothetical protein